MSGFWSSIKHFLGFEKSELVKKLDQLQADALAEHNRKIKEHFSDGQKEISAKIEEMIIPALYQQAETVNAIRELTFYCHNLLAHNDGCGVYAQLEKFLFAELKKRGITIKKKKNDWDEAVYILRW